jgi:hypothetical protein
MYRAATKSGMVRRIALILTLSTLIPVLLMVAALSGSAGTGTLWRWLVFGAAEALLCTGIAVVYLVRRYQPGLMALR